LKIKKVMLKTIFDVYNNASQRLEDFMFKYIMPIVFRVILLGLRLTLIWAVYLIFTEVL